MWSIQNKCFCHLSRLESKLPPCIIAKTATNSKLLYGYLMKATKIESPILVPWSAEGTSLTTIREKKRHIASIYDFSQSTFVREAGSQRTSQSASDIWYYHRRLFVCCLLAIKRDKPQGRDSIPPWLVKEKPTEISHQCGWYLRNRSTPMTENCGRANL